MYQRAEDVPPVLKHTLQVVKLWGRLDQPRFGVEVLQPRFRGADEMDYFGIRAKSVINREGSSPTHDTSIVKNDVENIQMRYYSGTFSGTHQLTNNVNDLAKDLISRILTV